MKGKGHFCQQNGTEEVWSDNGSQTTQLYWKHGPCGWVEGVIGDYGAPGS